MAPIWWTGLRWHCQHEPKPLNFAFNNFSEVNKEMIDEMQLEIDSVFMLTQKKFQTI